MPNLFSLLSRKRFCRALFDCLGVLGPCYFVGDVDAKELEALNLLNYSPIDENGGVLGPPFPVVHNHLLCLDHVEGEVLVLVPHGGRILTNSKMLYCFACQTCTLKKESLQHCALVSVILSWTFLCFNCIQQIKSPKSKIILPSGVLKYFLLPNVLLPNCHAAMDLLI